MTLAYLLGALFLGWLVVVLYRVILEWRAARGTGGGTAGQVVHFGDSKRLAVLLQDEGNWAEWLVRGRISAAVKREPELRVVLVDGDSVDETPLILERMARRLNMGFCRLDDLGEQCARSGMAGTSNDCRADLLTNCPAPCFVVAGLDTGTGGGHNTARTARCVVLTSNKNAAKKPYP